MKRFKNIFACTGNIAKRLVRRPVALRDRASSMIWMKLIVLVLFLPVYWEEVLPSNMEAFAEHMTEMGEHCFDHCPHPSPLIDKAPQADFAEVPLSACLLSAPVMVARYSVPLARDRPPPLPHGVTVHSLRAPPTLIPA